jgi:hypothetical protein
LLVTRAGLASCETGQRFPVLEPVGFRARENGWKFGDDNLLLHSIYNLVLVVVSSDVVWISSRDVLLPR